MIQHKHSVGFATHTDSLSHGGSVGLTEALGFPAQANNARRVVGRGEETLHFAPSTLGAAMRTFPDLAPLNGIVVRMEVHGRQEALSVEFCLVPSLIQNGRRRNTFDRVCISEADQGRLNRPVTKDR